MGGACSSVEKAELPFHDRARRRSLTEVLSIKDSAAFKERYSSSTSSKSPRSPRFKSGLLYVTHKATNCEYVCRTINKKRAPCKDVQAIMEHFQRLNSLEHPHLCKFVEVFEDAQVFFLIYERANPMTLFQHIKQGDNFAEEDAAEYARQILMALAVGHEHGIFHGRLSPTKVIITDMMGDAEEDEDDSDLPAQVKICDMGQGLILRESCAVQLRLSAESGDSKEAPKSELVECMPPEIAWDEVASVEPSDKLPVHLHKLDMWSLGCIVYHMLTGTTPFTATTSLELMEQVKTAGVEYGSEWAELSREARDATEAMLKVNAGLRPTAATMLRHPWVRMPRARLQKNHLMRLLRNIRQNASEGHFKRMVMRVIAHQLPSETREVARIENAFRFFDRNGDGVLGVSEICEQVRKTHISELDELAQDLEGVVGLLDRDGSRTVNLQEFVAGSLNPKLATKNSILWYAFSAFDRDNDGQVSVDEIVSIVRQIEAGLLGTEQVDGLVTAIREELKNITPKPYIDFDQFVYIMSTPTGVSDGNKAMRRDMYRNAYNLCGVDCYNVRKNRPLTWNWQQMSQSPASAYKRLNLVNVTRENSHKADGGGGSPSDRARQVRAGKQPAQGKR